MASTPDFSDLLDLVHTWLASTPRPLERAAACKDVQGLLNLAHKNPASLRIPSSTVVNNLIDLSRALHRFIKQDIAPLLESNNIPSVPLSSPYIGGATSSASQASDPGGQRQSINDASRLLLATMNPGRTGLAALGTDAVLFWRLWALDWELHERGVQFCVLPGARFPPGVSLPADFHYAWRGIQTTSWNSVGVFIHVEVESLFTQIEGYGNDRIIWFMVATGNGSMILGAVYGPPGGDYLFWEDVMRHLARLRQKFPGLEVLLAGDANIHLSYLLEHETSCSRAHCKQSYIDSRIENLLVRHRLYAKNPGKPTHVSGTAIDLFLADSEVQISVTVDDSCIGLSDHFLSLLIQTVL